MNIIWYTYDAAYNTTIYTAEETYTHSTIILPPIQRGCFQTNLRYTYDAVDVNTLVKWYYMKTECTDSYLQQYRVPNHHTSSASAAKQSSSAASRCYHQIRIWFTTQMLYAKTLYSTITIYCIMSAYSYATYYADTVCLYIYALTTKSCETMRPDVEIRATTPKLLWLLIVISSVIPCVCKHHQASPQAVREVPRTYRQSSDTRTSIERPPPDQWNWNGKKWNEFFITNYYMHIYEWNRHTYALSIHLAVAHSLI